MQIVNYQNECNFLFDSRQQAIKEAEKNRRLKYKAQDEEREVIRSELSRNTRNRLI